MKRSINKIWFPMDWCLTVHCKLQFNFFLPDESFIGDCLPFLISNKIQVHTVPFSLVWHIHNLSLSSLYSSIYTSSKQKFNYLLDGYHDVKFRLKGQWKGTHRHRAWVYISHCHRKPGLKIEDLRGKWAALWLTATHSLETSEISEYKKLAVPIGPHLGHYKSSELLRSHWVYIHYYQ